MQIFPRRTGLECVGQRPTIALEFASRWIHLVFAVCCLLAAKPSSGQGLLDSLRDDVRSAGGDFVSGTDEDDDDDSKSDCGEHCDGRSNFLDDDDDNEAGFAKLTLLAVTSPVWLPKVLIDDTTLEPGYFARYPYRCELDGYMAPDAEFLRQRYPWLESDRYRWLLRLRGEYATDFGDLSRAGGQLLFDTASRWGLDTEAIYLHEQLPADGRDQLWLGDVNVVYRFAQSPKLQMRTGLGMNWLSDAFGSDLGFNFTYSGDFFPADPWIMSAELDWGTLGHAGLFHTRVTVGVHLHRFEIYTGYDYLDVGDTQVNSAVSGVRVWY